MKNYLKSIWIYVSGLFKKKKNPPSANLGGGGGPIEPG